jgi:hypothetical protein
MKNRPPPNYHTHPDLNRRTYIISVTHCGTRCIRRFFDYTKTRYADLHFPIDAKNVLAKKYYVVIPIRDPIEVVYSHERRRAAQRYNGLESSINYLFTRRMAAYWDWLNAQSVHDRASYVAHIPVDRTTLPFQGDPKENPGYCTQLPELRSAITRRDRAALYELAPDYLWAMRETLAQPCAYWASIGNYDLWYL